MPVPCYSPKLDEALAFAADAFRDKRRKTTPVPYLSHLLQVAVTVMEHGGDEDQIIAAVLHDYLEDIEGADASSLAERFGPRVAHFVQDLSDATVRPKPPWQARKSAYLERLRDKPAELKLISCADKLHNARSILRDRGQLGERVWERFSVPKAQSLWYYREVVVALGAGWQSPMLDELRAVVDALHVA